MNFKFYKEKGHDNSASDVTPQYYDEVLHEPPREDSLHRALKARQISMIAVCVCIFSSQSFDRDNCRSSAALSGRVLSLVRGRRSGEEGHLVSYYFSCIGFGPYLFWISGLFLGYSFVGFICYLVMIALGEMASYLPHKKGFAGYATRFVDPAVGFALGWNYLMKYVSFSTLIHGTQHAKPFGWV